MGDFLQNLTSRSLSTQSSLTPITPSLFEPVSLAPSINVHDSQLSNQTVEVRDSDPVSAPSTKVQGHVDSLQAKVGHHRIDGTNATVNPAPTQVESKNLGRAILSSTEESDYGSALPNERALSGNEVENVLTGKSLESVQTAKEKIVDADESDRRKRIRGEYGREKNRIIKSRKDTNVAVQPSVLTRTQEAPDVAVRSFKQKKETPAIKVKVGRIEIGNTNMAAQGQKAASGIRQSKIQSVMSLENYLKLRSEGKLS